MAIRMRAIAVVAAFAASAALLAGCSAIDDVLSSGSDAPVRDEDTQEIAEAGDADVFQLKLGDCIDEAGAAEVSEVPVVPCADPHDYEIYHEFTMPEGAFPGDDAIVAAAEAECAPTFDTFVGLAYAESTLEYNYFTPTEGGWDGAGDRVVQCLVYEPDVKTSGSLAGAAR